MRKGFDWAIAGVFAAMLLISASSRGSSEPTSADALDFVAKAEADLAQESDYLNHAGWVQATYISSDTNWLLAKANAEVIDRTVRYAKEAARFDHVKVDDVTARKLYLLKQSLVLPASSRPGASQELAQHCGETRYRLFDSEIYVQRSDTYARRHGRHPANVARPKRNTNTLGRLAGSVFAANESRLRALDRIGQ
jgi:hypothetical protein